MNIRKITLVHHTHTDIGYTGIYPDVAAQHIRHLRSVLEHCRRDGRFRWTIESGWALEQFLSVASEEERKELTARVASGQIEMTGFYAQSLTQLCNLEELCGTLELSLQLARQVGAPMETAILDDIGGLSFNFPQIANYYGIRYLLNGGGGWRVMLPFTTLPHLFHLVGPDGSRILFYQIGDDRENRSPDIGPAQYGFGEIYFLWPMLKEIDAKGALPGNDGEKSIFTLRGREGIDALLARLQRDDYPCDTLLVQLASDNFGPWERVLEVIDYWNAHYGEPEIRLGTCGDFFHDVETRFGRDLSVIQGELTCSWTEHAVTNAYATGRYRRAGRLLNTWSALDACCGRTEPDPWWGVMKNLALYNDHTCGISMWQWRTKTAESGSFWHERFNLPRQSWQIKTRYAEEALAYVEKAMDRCFIRLASDDIDSPETISVMNPHSFPADGRTEFRTATSGIELVSEENTTLPVETVDINSKWRLHKADVGVLPPYGFKTFRIRQAAKPPGNRYVCEDWALRGPAGAARVDPQTGAVRSWTTEDRNGDWIDAAHGHVNELHYFDVEGVTPGPFWGGLNEDVRFHRLPLRCVRKCGGHSGVHSAGLLVERVLRQGERDVLVETHYLLDAGGLRLRNRIRKIHTTENEACFFAFPFALAGPFRFDVEQQGQVTRFPDERLPGSTNHNLGMQDFISISDESSQIVLTSLQACLIALGKPSYYHYDLEYQAIDHPTVYSYAFNNLWNTNCPVHQQNDLEFEYHVAVFPHPYSPVTAYRTSRQAAQPPSAFPGDLRSRGLNAGDTNLIRLSSDQVLVESIRPESEKVWQLRLIEIARQDGGCDVTFSPNRFSHYALPRHATDKPQWRSATENPVRLTFRPAECRTLLLRTAK
jgi:hypothetical protein